MENRNNQNEKARYVALALGVITVLSIMYSITPVSAAGVTVPVSGNVLQSISLSSTGSATGQSFVIGENAIDSVSITRKNNVPIKISVADAMEAGKPEVARGHLQLFMIAAGTYAAPDFNGLDEHIRIAYGSGAYFTVETADLVLLQENLPAGEVTDVLHLRQNVPYTEAVLTPDGRYQITLQVDTIPA